MTTPDRTEAKPVRRRRWLVWVLLCLVVALGSAGVVALWLLPSAEERPEHADRPRALERHEFDGALLVMSLGEGAVDASGEQCSGADGYEDVNAATPVVVANAEGQELARTELGPGEALDERSCVFGFTVELTEGEEHYEITIGDRGGRTLTWEGLHEQGALSFVLGGVG